MIKITFIQPDGRAENVEVPEHWSVMQAALAHKIRGIEGSCGGTMACATCHVHIHPDWLDLVAAEDNEQSEEEKDILELASDLRENSRLSCQIKLSAPLNGLIIALPRGS